MTNVLKLNSISKKVNDVLTSGYALSDDCATPDAVLVRSFNMHEWAVPETLQCVARAGAGVNNIPTGEYAKRGIVVFNTPGANANAVKELVIGALFIAARNIFEGNAWANTLTGDDVKKQVEKGKGQFAGTEVLGKTIGVLGLGAIGRKVAAACNALGMTVVGYDPFLSENAKAEIPFVTVYKTMDEVFAASDFVTLHMPFTPETKNLIGSAAIAKMKDGVIIINAARGELVNNADIKDALTSGKVRKYVVDFPDGDCLNFKGIVAIPHLGASTLEAEDNCAVMAAEEIKAYIEEGNIINSVNLPNLKVAKDGAHRIGVIYKGKLGKVNGKVTTATRGEYNYSIIDGDETDASAITADELIKVRVVY